MTQIIGPLWVELTGAAALASTGAEVRYFEGKDSRPVYIKDGPNRPENNTEDAVELNLHDERIYEEFDTTLWVRTAWGEATVEVIARDGGALANNVASLMVAVAALQVAVSPDNATQAELDAAVAALQTTLGDKVDQSVYDTMVAGNATDAELAIVVAALNDVENELDGIIANTGEVVPVGGRVIPLDDPRPYINNTAAPITLTGNTVADITGDGLTLDNSGGTVSQWVAGVPLTTTNGAMVVPGEYYVSFPDGTTFGITAAPAPSAELIGVQPPLYKNTYINNTTGTVTLAPFTATCAGNWTVELSGEWFNTATASGILYLGTDGAANDRNLFDGSGDRIDGTTKVKTYTVPLAEGQQVFPKLQAGGGSIVENIYIDITPPANCVLVPRPEVNIANLETLGDKLHAAYFPKAGKLCDLTGNGRDLEEVIGAGTYDANGDLVLTNGNRLRIGTDGDGSGIWVYARVRDDAQDGFVSVLNNTDSFIPLAQNGSSDTNIVRISTLNNTHTVRVNGRSTFANRNQMYDSLSRGDFVDFEVEALPNGIDLFLGDHPQNDNFDFRGTVRSLIVLNEAPSAGELAIIRAALADGLYRIGKSKNFLTTPQLFDGVMVDAAPPWTGNVIVASGSTEIISTGLDLNTVDEVIVYFSQSNSGTPAWPQRHSFRPTDIILNVVQGWMFNHFDTRYLAISNMTSAQLAAGDIPFRTNTGSGVIDYDISRIEFRKSVVGNSSRIGEMVHASSAKFTNDADAVAKGYLPVKAGTVVNGASDYPIWAAIYPEFVSGTDIVFPTDAGGMFLRNLGGNAGAEGVFQNYAQAFTPNAPTGTQVNSGGGNTVRGRTTSPETRPANRAYQLYTIVDSYLESGSPSAGASDATLTQAGIDTQAVAAVRTVTFPAPFKAGTVPVVVVTALSATVGDAETATLRSAPTPAGFTVEVMEDSSGAGGGGGSATVSDLHWVAVGEPA